MSVIIRIQGLPWSASSVDLRRYFDGIHIPDGGVHIVGGEKGDAFVSVSSYEDACRILQVDTKKKLLNGVRIQLSFSSSKEMTDIVKKVFPLESFEPVASHDEKSLPLPFNKSSVPTQLDLIPPEKNQQEVYDDTKDRFYRVTGTPRNSTESVQAQRSSKRSGKRNRKRSAAAQLREGNFDRKQTLLQSDNLPTPKFSSQVPIIDLTGNQKLPGQATATIPTSFQNTLGGNFDRKQTLQSDNLPTPNFSSPTPIDNLPDRQKLFGQMDATIPTSLQNTLGGIISSELFEKKTKKCIMIHGLPLNFNVSTAEDFIHKIDGIIPGSFFIENDTAGNCMGKAFVEFATQAKAERAIQSQVFFPFEAISITPETMWAFVSDHKNSLDKVASIREEFSSHSINKVDNSNLSSSVAVSQPNMIEKPIPRSSDKVDLSEAAPLRGVSSDSSAKKVDWHKFMSRVNDRIERDSSLPDGLSDFSSTLSNRSSKVHTIANSDVPSFSEEMLRIPAAPANANLDVMRLKGMLSTTDAGNLKSFMTSGSGDRNLAGTNARRDSVNMSQLPVGRTVADLQLDMWLDATRDMLKQLERNDHRADRFSRTERKANHHSRESAQRERHRLSQGTRYRSESGSQKRSYVSSTSSRLEVPRLFSRSDEEKILRNLRCTRCGYYGHAAINCDYLERKKRR